VLGLQGLAADCEAVKDANAVLDQLLAAEANLDRENNETTDAAADPKFAEGARVEVLHPDDGSLSSGSVVCVHTDGKASRPGPVLCPSLMFKARKLCACL